MPIVHQKPLPRAPCQANQWLCAGIPSKPMATHDHSKQASGHSNGVGAPSRDFKLHRELLPWILWLYDAWRR
ncbi:hypothetical protein WN944_014584 [Citrus x changshan-huyou]|uniref:Uncharacterized protein n=1 Tax=Citrus x changshan-huyou TaxID=2935761 RepID=A0AAP0M8M6_9ROSI